MKEIFNEADFLKETESSTTIGRIDKLNHIITEYDFSLSQPCNVFKESVVIDLFLIDVDVFLLFLENPRVTQYKFLS